MLIRFDCRTGKLGIQLIDQAPLTFSECDRAYSPFRRSDQQLPQRTLHRCKFDTHSFSSFSIGGRCHPELRIGFFIKPAARPITRFIDCATHRFTGFNTRLEFFSTARFGILARCDPHQLFEKPLEMKPAQLYLMAEILQIWSFIEVEVDQAADTLDELGLRIS